jgi:carbon monoxide dehydrogenase subunit G
MRLEHRFTVPASVEQAWAVLNDLEQVVPCFPGASLTSVDGDEFAGACKIKLGPISLQYNGTGRFAERDEASHRVVVEGKGKDRRGNGTATVLVTAALTGTGDAATAVAVDTDLTVTGKPAQFGRGLIQDVSDKLLEQFVSCISDKLSGPKPRPNDVRFGGGQDGAGEGSGGERPSEPSAVSHARTGAGPQGSGTPPGPGPASSVQDEPAAAVDLGAALVPVVAKRAAPYLIGAAVALLLRRLFTR